LMTRVAVLGGTGDLGFGLSLRLAKAGVEVVVGSRSAEKALAAAERVRGILGGGSVSGAVNREAVRGCGFVFFTIPYEAVDEIAADVAANLEEGCVVVSCVVAPRDALAPTSEKLAKHLPASARLVTALHTVSASLISDPATPLNTDTFLFGDDMDAKKEVARLLLKIEGLRPVDGGPLKNSVVGEQLTWLLVGVNKRYGVGHAGIKVTGLPDEAVMNRWTS
jgi:NADPH-dependent F420 reductase